MHVFVTGGSGLTGPAIVAELIAAGHTVTGLARSDEAAARLRGLGAETLTGALEDLDTLRAGAKAADGVIHMAFGGSFADPEDLVRRDRTAIETLGQALAGSGKPFVSTSGTLVMPSGRVTAEDDAPDPESIGWFRIPGERACLAFAGQGVRSSIVRLAPTVHGPGDYGFIPMLIAAARKNGVSAYIGDGANRWPAVHRLDAAALFRLALEKAPAGRPLHGAAENVTLRGIAEQVARILGIPAASLTPEQAAEHFGDPFMARVFAADAPVSSEAGRTLLGWTPVHPTLLHDIETGDYCTVQPTTAQPNRPPDIGDTYAQRLRDLGAAVTGYGDGLVQRVKAVSDGPVDLVLDTAPVGRAPPDLVEIADGDPRRVLTISDVEAAQQLGVRDTFHEAPDLLSHRFEAFPEFARRAAAGTFSVPIARTFPLEDWRAALEISLTGHARGKLLLLP